MSARHRARALRHPVCVSAGIRLDQRRRVRVVRKSRPRLCAQARTRRERRDTLPFHGGWLVLLSYEIAAEIEPTLRCRLRRTIASGRAGGALSGGDHRRSRARTDDAGRRGRLIDICCDTTRRRPRVAHSGRRAVAESTRVEEDDPQRFLDGVARIHEYLRAGDMFQVNLSREWRVSLRTRHARRPTSIAPCARPIRRRSPGCCNGTDWAVISVVAGTAGRSARRHGADASDRGHASAHATTTQRASAT